MSAEKQFYQKEKKEKGIQISERERRDCDLRVLKKEGNIRTPERDMNE